jgi:hypothetical protein
MASNQQLTTILEDFKAAKANADLDIDMYPMKVRASKSIAKADGARQLDVLKKEYGQEFSNRAAVIMTVGTTDAQNVFLKVAREIAGPTLLSASALESYTKMATDIEPTIGSEREFAGTQLGHLLRSLEAVGRDAGSSFLKTPTLIEGVFIVRTFDDLVTGVRDLLLPQVGAVLNRDYIQTAIVRRALDIGFTASTAPVVVTDASPKEIEFFSSNLFNGVAIVVNLPEDESKVDEEFVIATFDKLKAAKKQANNQQFNSSN